MNRLTIIGNLTRDPELRSVMAAGQQQTVCSYTVAVNRPRKNGQDMGADFFRVSVWGRRAETDSRYLRKGSKVCVSGPVRASAYTDRDGAMRAQMELMANEVEYLSSSQGADEASAKAAPPVDAQTGYAQVDPEDLPF